MGVLCLHRKQKGHRVRRSRRCTARIQEDTEHTDSVSVSAPGADEGEDGGGDGFVFLYLSLLLFFLFFPSELCFPSFLLWIVGVFG